MPVNLKCLLNIKSRGFTLIEIIMTIVILGFTALILVPYFGAIISSPDPLIREKSISLGQALMDEILSKKWDANTPNGGGPICSSESVNSTARASIQSTCDYGTPTQPIASAIGLEAGDHDGTPDASERMNWDDVD